MHICGLNASAIESLWLRDTNAEIDGDFGGDTYSAMVPADEENYSDKNRTTNYSHLQDLEEKLNSSCYKVVRIAHKCLQSKDQNEQDTCLQRQCKFKILTITETHLDSLVSGAVVNIEGMKFLRLDKKSSKGGGCILFYSKHLCAVNWKDLFVDGLEAIWPQVKFPSCSVFQ